MIIPSKFITLQQSILGRLPLLLAFPPPYTIHQLYERVEGDFPDINDFIYAVDTLYVLGKLDVDLESGIVRHAA